MNKVLLIILTVCLVGSVSAQERLSDEKRKEFDAQKVAFYTQELDLSPAEAAKFWPLYNEMQKKSRTIEGQMKKDGGAMKNAKGLKEEQYAEAVKKMLAGEEKVLAIKKEYYQKMLLVLPASKLWKLGEAERKFHRQLFDRLRRESGPRPK